MLIVSKKVAAECAATITDFIAAFVAENESDYIQYLLDTGQYDPNYPKINSQEETATHERHNQMSL
jgi:hypothetical protein